jgi:tRNA threonylcarbamoyladenosine biosynthesis protein TsaB
MLILAIDTTGEAGGVAIYRDEECLASIAHEGGTHGYSVSLFQMVERLVAEVSRKHHPPLSRLADIEVFAVASGPGSFTGIRVGLSAVQAWSKAFAKPAKGISVLEALVETASPRTGHALPILNAYRGEFYAGIFRRTKDDRFAAAGEGLAMKPEALNGFVAEQLRACQDLTCIVRDHDVAAQSLRTSLPGGLAWESVGGTLLPSIARLARCAALEGRLDSLGQLDAYYFRRTDAELALKGQDHSQLLAVDSPSVRPEDRRLITDDSTHENPSRHQR